MEGTPARLLTAQVERRQDAERHHRQAHQEDHHHGAEDRGEDAALGVGLARLLGQEGPEPARIDRGAAAPAEVVRGVGAIDVERAQLLLLAVDGLEHHPRAADRLHLLDEPLFGLGVGRLLARLALVERLALGCYVACGIPLLPVVELAAIQADPLERVVDPADLVLLDRLDRPPVAGGARDELVEHGRRAGARGHLLVAVEHPDRRADQRPVLAALDQVELARPRALGDLVFVHPFEIGAVEVAVADLELQAVLLGVGRLVGVGDHLPLRQLAREQRAVLELHLLERRRPEDPEAVREDHEQHAQNHHQAHPERAAGEPDQVIAAGQYFPEVHRQIALYFSRRRWRTSSASVLTKKVIRNSTQADRNSTR